MSHYSVLVLTKGKKPPTDGELYKILIPYKEYDGEAEVLPYTEFVDNQAELERDYSELTDAGKMSFGEYASSRGYEQSGKTGRYGYRTNPKGKWDWFEVGGRWSGLLKGRSSAGCNPAGMDGLAVNGELREGRTTCASLLGWKPADGVDVMKLSDVDWKTMTGGDEALKKEARAWEMVVEGSEPRNEDEKRELNELHFYRKRYLEERYQTKERFVKERTSFATHALVSPDGGWHESGAMGWWGVSNATDAAERGWSDGYRKLVDGYSGDDVWVTVVDCHI